MNDNKASPRRNKTYSAYSYKVYKNKKSSDLRLKTFDLKKAGYILCRFPKLYGIAFRVEDMYEFTIIIGSDLINDGYTVFP